MFCECENIVVRRDRTVVLDIERLAIESGSITTVLGANGAGKTTLLEVLALLRPAAGQLRLWGKPARANDRTLRPSVVMVMHPGYLFRGSVWNNVLYGLRPRHIPRREAQRRAAEALEMVGLGNFARRNVAKLSAGERQRVNLARAIATEPKALLLDEPGANVDAATVELIGELFKRLRDERGTTIVQASPAASRLHDASDTTIQLTDGHIAT